ncbi:MAG: phosphate/phosphite/phosphonate ABC transporter substrate-binding protein [Burkholderiaceae bacterium]|nr:phosphate/phosphite/phosphonate ABC transporter substrate-binding protein [Burkholderiaceae bacterium]MCD8515878.1 phosphate/phosphite/phosphonate ABC transporter substrate-binding protein [Burkholderiaceae bacterium]MCD8538101.1 phosphate/phosphite/phosphonate ABC transporter substrate-binding protein [Burkholderiaceae bacterium]MCD8565708.1 phosphate/phosphite/phosphonate ABC transporter substrate-binding protein [Burkholderiaceae bacterium]
MNRRAFNCKAVMAITALTLSTMTASVFAQDLVLRVGLGPQQPTAADTKRVWEPIYQAVADKIGAKLELKVANDWAGISTALANEQIDVAQMGPWGYVLAHKNGGAQIINTMLVNGKPYYKAIIVGRADLNIKDFPADAKGLSMQMLDVGSTSGWLVPTYVLKQQGVDPKTFFGKYAEGASAAAAQMATVNGQVDLATGWDTHRNIMIKNGTIKETDNQVIWESEPLPNEVVAVRKGMSADMKKRLQDAFVAITNEAIAKQLPYPYTGYVAATDEPYNMLAEMGYTLGALKR